MSHQHKWVIVNLEKKVFLRIVKWRFISLFLRDRHPNLAFRWLFEKIFTHGTENLEKSWTRSCVSPATWTWVPTCIFICLVSFICLFHIPHLVARILLNNIFLSLLPPRGRYLQRSKWQWNILGLSWLFDYSILTQWCPVLWSSLIHGFDFRGCSYLQSTVVQKC